MAAVSRRQFLGVALTAAAAAAVPALLRAQGGAIAPATLTVHPEREIGRFPANYTGLSYEAGQLAEPDFFSPANSSLIGLFRRLGDRGVLRIGGNSSEFAVWSPEGPPAGGLGTMVVGNKVHKLTATTPQAIQNLSGFLDLVGWQLIYGVNLGTGSPAAAADEAAAVWQATGRRIIAFQIGNEPDLYHHNGLRPPTYGFPDYLAEWQRFAAAIRARVPEAPLAAPDVANNVDWVREMAEDAGNMIVLLTGHYYAEGPPANPAMTIERLLSPNPRLLTSMASLMETSRQYHLPYRMAEGNSCYDGGKKGVSDTFASALWAGDYMLQVAQAGYVGVNFHGGGRGAYTPIASHDGINNARPIYYGMLLAGQLAGARLVEADCNSGGTNATAYAGRAGDHTLIAIFNKDEGDSLRLSIDCGRPVRAARLWRLAAPAVDSATGVTLAGAEVSDDGGWTPANEERVSATGQQMSIDLPPASAALVFVR